MAIKPVRPAQPVKTTSSVTPLRLRTDLPREKADSYWEHQHADIVRKLKHITEYNQHHFSLTDHGYWPATEMVGTFVPPDWQLDGTAELRFPSAIGQLRNLPGVRPVVFDEQNPFEMVTGYVTGGGGGRWWTTGLDESVGHRTVVFLRRRRGVPTSAFRRFVHDRLGPALNAAGALDLRTYVFAPYLPITCKTPGVLHVVPPHRRHHASVVFGTESRSRLDDLLGSTPMKAVLEEQHLFLTGAHAHSVERTVAGIRVK
jgi:hypothetical protein